MTEQLPRMYTDLADWFHLVTPPEEYAEEAGFYLRVLTEASDAPPRTLLELGSGGGNNAWHYKRGKRSLLAPAPSMVPTTIAAERTSFEFFTLASDRNSSGFKH